MWEKYHLTHVFNYVNTAVPETGSGIHWWGCQCRRLQAHSCSVLPVEPGWPLRGSCRDPPHASKTKTWKKKTSVLHSEQNTVIQNTYLAYCINRTNINSSHCLTTCNYFVLLHIYTWLMTNHWPVMKGLSTRPRPGRARSQSWLRPELHSSLSPHPNLASLRSGHWSFACAS